MLRADASSLAAFLWRLKITAQPQYSQIVSAIRTVTPFFLDFQLRELSGSPHKTRLEWHEKGADTYFNAHSLSDGTLRFICLATLLLQPELPATIAGRSRSLRPRVHPKATAPKISQDASPSFE